MTLDDFLRRHIILGHLHLCDKNGTPRESVNVRASENGMISFEEVKPQDGEPFFRELQTIPGFQELLSSGWSFSDVIVDDPKAFPAVVLKNGAYSPDIL